MSDYKLCGRCRIVKPISDFATKTGNQASGKQAWCKSCTAAYYTENKDIISAYKKKKYRDAHPLPEKTPKLLKQDVERPGVSMYYTGYARHYMRMYVRQDTMKSDADREGCFAAREAMARINESERIILRKCYSVGQIKDNVHSVAVNFGMSEDEVWSLIAEAEFRMAKVRGLI